MTTQYRNTDDRVALLQGTLDILILKTLVLGAVSWARRGSR